MSGPVFRVGTRGSQLAMTQSRWAAEAVSRAASPRSIRTWPPSWSAARKSFGPVAIEFRCSVTAVTVAAPALTLTDHVRPWGVGRGCTSALVDVTARDPLWTATNQYIYGSADATSFTIRELVA